MPDLLVAGVIGFVIGFHCAAQWKIVDLRSRIERRTERRRERRWARQEAKRGARLGVENVRGRG